MNEIGYLRHVLARELIVHHKSATSHEFDDWLRRVALPAVRAERVAAPPAPAAASVPAAPQSGAPVLTAKEGRVTTSSRDVAEFFGKEHRDVLRGIDNLLKDMGDTPLRNFTQGSYTLPSTGSQQHRQYEMDRDGFTLLAMGFTGSQALKFKLAYIAEFNRMEEALRAPPVPLTREQQLAVALRLADDTIRGVIITETLCGPHKATIAGEGSRFHWCWRDLGCYTRSQWTPSIILSMIMRSFDAPAPSVELMTCFTTACGSRTPAIGPIRRYLVTR